MLYAGTGLTGGGTSGDTLTLDLEPSGVTAATYGTATSIPQITVDALGRVTTVTSLDVSDHTQSLSWNAANTTLQIGGGNSVDLSSLADVSTTSIASLSDIDTLSGISNGQALLWNTAESKFKYGNVSGGGASNAYKTITVSGQSNVVATGEDTLTLVAGSGTTITTDAGATSVTITSTPDT